MKDLLRSDILLSLVLCMTLLTGCKESPTAVSQQEHFCPMHPTVRSAGPGTCPICLMDLVAVGGEGSDEPLGAAATLAGPANESFINGIQTVRGTYTGAAILLEADARVERDDRRTRTVTTRVSGRLISVNVRSAGQTVSAGQVLATLYSPELLEAQQNFLSVLGSAEEQPARQQLLQLGLSEKQIENIGKSRQPLQEIPVISPIAGYLLPSADEVAGSPGIQDEMNAASGPSAVTGGGDWRPGNTVAAGQTLFRIADNQFRALVINLPPAQAIGIRIGDSITAVLPNGKRVSSRIASVDPVAGDGFTTARAYLQAPEIPVGTWLKTIRKSAPEGGLWIPSAAVLDLGQRQIVFVKSGESFRPKTVVTGEHAADRIRVIRGLSITDEIAASAAFLADGDAILQPAEIL